MKRLYSFSLLALLLTVTSSKAQSFFPGAWNYHRYTGVSPIPQMDSISQTPMKKWSLQKYTSLSAGMMMWKGGAANYVGAPIGLQLTRMLSNNVFAFAGVNAMPSYVNLRQSFFNTAAKTPGMQSFNSNQFGVFSRAELGIGYVNDARTFSITGSIGIQHSSMPFGYFPAGPIGAQSMPMLR